MTQALASFLERLGHRVIQTPSAYWYDAQPRFFLSLPHSQQMAPTSRELWDVFTTGRALGVRFPAAVTAPGRASYDLVVEDPGYGLERLSANTRSKIRRGLKHCEVRRVEPAFVREHGQPANQDTLRRLRFQRDVYEWDRYWDAVQSSPAIEVWAALREHELLAYLVVAVDGTPEILVARSLARAFHFYPNNALLFTVVQDLVHRPGVPRVFFGLESVEGGTGVDDFKLSMGFVRRSIRQRIVFRPALEWVVRHTMLPSLLGRVARSRQHSEFWRKVEGVLVFHGSLAASRGA